MAIADAEKALQCPCSSNLSYIAKAQAFYSRYVINYVYTINSRKLDNNEPFIVDKSRGP